MSKGDKVSIELVGGPPWGFRLGGGADFECPLEIAKLRRRSKAFSAGLAEGDVVTNIDHQEVSSKSHGDAMKIIELAGPTLYLEIVKGVGPSANLANSSMMSESMSESVTDGSVTMTTSNNYIQEQRPVTATIVRSSREPSISRIELARERSIPRTVNIIPSSTIKNASSASTMSEPWTVDVTSYQFTEPVSAPKQSQLVVQPKQPPPVSPKPKFKAKSLPREPVASQSKSCPVIQSWGMPPTNPVLQNAWSPATSTSAQPLSLDQNSNVQSKPSPVFKVSKVNAKPQKWQPTTMLNVSYDNPRHQFNSSDVATPQASYPSAMSQSYDHSTYSPSKPPPMPTTNLMMTATPSAAAVVPQPPPSYSPAPPSMMSPPSSRKPANHIPGMVNPLICDDTQGDFGANPLVRPNKKLYSDSTFYDSPNHTYPTIQEQVAMAREISNFLESNHNKRSRGGRMFSKRKEKANEWSMDSQGQKKAIQQTGQFDDLYSDRPTFSMKSKEFGYNQVRHHPNPIKSKIDAAELEQIQHNQDFLCKHDTLPPNLAFDVNHALAESHGKAGQFFEKRRQRAEKYIVDENNRKNWYPNSTNLQVQINQPENHSQSHSTPTKPYVSPWDAAAQGNLELAYQTMPQPNSVKYHQTPLANSYVQQPLNVITDQSNARNGPQLNVKYKIIKPVTPSPGISNYSSPISNTLPRRKTRLDMMIEGNSGSNYDSAANNSNIHANLNYSTLGMQASAPPGSMTQSQPAAFSPMTNFSRPQGDGNYQSNNFTRNTLTMSSLRRPKDYMPQQQARSGSATVSAF